MTDQPISRTPEQERAAFALEQIQKLVEEWKGDLQSQKEFNSHASSMPFMIRTNGLGQAAAFYRSKRKKKAYLRLYEVLGTWLTSPEQPFDGHEDLLEAITHTDQDTYIAAQLEALLFFEWVKKLSNALLAHEEDGTASREATA